MVIGLRACVLASCCCWGVSIPGYIKSVVSLLPDFAAMLRIPIAHTLVFTTLPLIEYPLHVHTHAQGVQAAA